MKASIYCRVSTEGQEQDGTSLQTQMEACRNYCQSRGYEVGYELSEAWSTRNEQAPEFPPDAYFNLCEAKIYYHWTNMGMTT